MIPVNRPFIVPERLICRECGSDMKPEITRPNKGRLIKVVYKCEPCGYQHIVTNPQISLGENLSIPKPVVAAVPEPSPAVNPEPAEQEQPNAQG